MQSHNGGWGAFDADNTYYYLNYIPFSDHGALLDPPSEDVTGALPVDAGPARRETGREAALERAIDYLRETQLADGSWYGRWGMNYIYGTWSVLCALNAAGLDPKSDLVRKAADWLIAIQNPDGGWGEDATSYKLDYRGYEPAPSTASQTAWALLGLMSAGARPSRSAARHRYLPASQAADGFWNEPRFTATGFPRVFYLRYHGYRNSFRCGRWRATAICRRPTAQPLRMGCEAGREPQKVAPRFSTATPPDRCVMSVTDQPVPML